MRDVVGGKEIETGVSRFSGEKAKDHAREIEAHRRNLEDKARGLKTMANPLPDEKLVPRED